MPSVSPSRRPPAACTIISRNYLSHARILAQSYARHEPGGRFYLLVVDGLPEGVEVGADVHLLGPDDLDRPDFYELCFMYDVPELCTAVKPSLLLLLLHRFQEEQVLFLDPDILVLRPLVELQEPLASSGIVLTPHTLRPLPLDGRRPGDQEFLLSGAYNLGFIGLKKSDETNEFLHWWEDRLREGGSLVDVPQGLMTDQKWIDLVPSYFPSTVILRDETYNVAYWNLHSRHLEKRGDRLLVNGRPLAFFHFSNFDPTKPLVLSKDQNRVRVVAGTPLAELLQLYADLQLRNGYVQTCQWPCGFSTFDNGVALNLPLRRLYLSLDEKARKHFENPFRVGGKDSFFDWATWPQSHEPDLSPFLLSLYHMRHDVVAALPDVRGQDHAAFLRWARTAGAGEMGYDPDAMRIPESAERPDYTFSSLCVPMRGFALGRYDGYQRLTDRIRQLVHQTLPPAATVLVVSKGDNELLELYGRRAWHFPQAEDGSYAGHYPANSTEAIAQLEALRPKGAEFLLFPNTALWWLDHYAAFKQHLENQYRVVVRQPDTCVVFALRDHGATPVLFPR